MLLLRRRKNATALLFLLVMCQRAIQIISIVCLLQLHSLPVMADVGGSTTDDTITADTTAKDKDGSCGVVVEQNTEDDTFTTTTTGGGEDACTSSDDETAAAADTDSHDNTHMTIILENKQEVSVEITDDLLQRIHAILDEKGALRGKQVDQSMIQQLAMEEVVKWHNEQEQAQQARALLWEQRQKLQQQPRPSEDEKPAFPYKLTVPPPPGAVTTRWSTTTSSSGNGSNSTQYYYDLDFCRKWNPPGGRRFAEYTSGVAPYKVTPEQKQESDDVARLRRPYIRRAMQHAWDGYRRYAFGYDEVRPQSRKGSNHWGGIGITLVDSLDTLWIMNMRDEFEQARDWVHNTLSHDQNTKVSVFETTIRSLAGLLSAYDWSRDEAFLDEALDLARRLMRAFVHPIAGETILPFGEVNLQDGSCSMIPWTGGNAILSEFGTLQLEFRYLDEVVQTSETRGFRDKVEGIFKLLHEISPDNGLFPYYMRTNHDTSKTKKDSNSPNIPYFSNDHLTFGAMADSFYEYMLKLWLQGGKEEPMYREMYDKAMQGMHDELLHVSSPSGLLYLADKVGSSKVAGKERIKHKMDHLVCFVGGMLALGAYTDPLGLESERAQRDLQTARALTYTCYQFYARMNTGISPEYVEFVAGQDFNVGRLAPHYLLRPEAVESFYILNVLTGDPIYREWGWEVFQSIEKYCKTRVAYGAISDVRNTAGTPRDEMESFFLSGAL